MSSNNSVSAGNALESLRGPCRSGLVSRKASVAGPAMSAAKLKPWGRCAALSRHKAAPTKPRSQASTLASSSRLHSC
ncbi:hypothetical protein FW789_15575 [Pseudomonas sp. 1121_17]